MQLMVVNGQSWAGTYIYLAMTDDTCPNMFVVCFVVFHGRARPLAGLMTFSQQCLLCNSQQPSQQQSPLSTHLHSGEPLARLVC